MRHGKDFIPVVVIICCAAAAVCCGVTLINRPGTNAETDTASVYILGPARSLLAQGLYEKADIYFHKGAPRYKEEAFDSFYQKWKRAICPAKHAHTEGNETAEILPWLRLASQSDPNNIEIYLVASFWLIGDCARPDLATQALSEAMVKNPDRYELPLEQARVDLSQSLFNNALESLDHALRLMREHAPVDQEQALIDLKFILIAKSFLLEAEGRNDECVQVTRELVKISPTIANHDRLERLETGSFDSSEAIERLITLFHREHECDQEHEHGPDCDDHDHDHDHDEHVHGPDCNHD